MPERDELLELRAENANLRVALKALNDHVGQIDNGYCAVCRIGYREWSTDGKRAGPCSNANCLSHQISLALNGRIRPAVRHA